MKFLSVALFLFSMAANADFNAAAINTRCLPDKSFKTKEVTHYMIPLLNSYSHRICDQIEGTCIYKKDGVPWLHNFGYADTSLAEARCKNGYGNQSNCLNPCRTVAASMKFHDYGQIVFIKSLVGQKCGTRRDGPVITHDGYVVVADTGSPKYFHELGRFDFFWGRCAKMKNGECLEGATTISATISDTDACIVWDPKDPNTNADLKNAFTSKVKNEALQRGDPGASQDFNL